MSAAGHEWRQHAACRGMDPADIDRVFFPPAPKAPRVNERLARQSEAEGKAVCARCPVRYECGAWAMETFQEFGIWGGLSPRERWEKAKSRGFKYTRNCALETCRATFVTMHQTQDFCSRACRRSWHIVLTSRRDARGGLEATG